MKNILLAIHSLIVISIASIVYSSSYAQQGIPYISNFKQPDTAKGKILGVTEDENGTIYLLNNKGLYSFDGFQWDLIFKEDKPLSFTINKKIVVSTEKGLFLINREQNKQLAAQPIADTTYDYYHKIIGYQEKIIAIGTQTILEVNSEQANTTPLYSINDSTKILTDAFYLNETLFVITNNRKVQKVTSGKATNVKQPQEIIEIGSLFSNHNNTEIYIIDNQGYLFTFNGSKFNRIAINDQHFLKESIITGGIAINEHTIALSTKLGGCIVINTKTGKTKHVLNYETGLPDDEIQTLGKDKNGGLWIAHTMGISRADLSLPIETINHFKGLAGYVLSAINLNGTYYVGTSEGLYILEEQKTFKEITVKRNTKVEKKTTLTPDSQAVEEKTEEEPNVKKKRFFGRLWQKITSSNPKDEEEPVSSSANETNSRLSSKEGVQYKKVLTLQSVEYFFKKIESINGKCTHLEPFNKQLLVGTSTGLYLVSGTNAKTIIPNIQVNTIKISKKQGAIIGGSSSLFIVPNDFTAQLVHSFGNEQVKSIAENSDNSLIVTTDSQVYYVKANGEGQPFIASYELPSVENGSLQAFNIGTAIYLLVSGNIYQLAADDTFKRDTLITKKTVFGAITEQHKVWLFTENGWQYQSGDNEKLGNAAPLIGLFDGINYISSSTSQLVMVNNNSQIVLINNPIQIEIDNTLPIFIKQILDYNGTILHPKHISLTKEQSAITIRVSAPFFLKEQSTQFQFKIEGLMSRWSEWNSAPAIELPYLPSGEYTIKVRAKDALQRESSVIPLPIYIKPQFWETPWFIALCIAFIAVVVFLLMKLRERQLKKERDILEQKVKERTATIAQQNKELSTQRDELANQNREILQQKEEIETQRDEIEQQRDKIVRQNEEITQSIVYAKRIQTAAMPNKDSISKIIPEHFVLFKPRDIVSGDFYWIGQKDCKTIIAAADCTGHGVPGAFMSMLGLSFLNDIVTRNEETQPALILNTLRLYIKTTLSQSGTEGETKDGMDIAICVIDTCDNTIQFAGAYNPLYYIKDGTLTEIKGDKMPVGIHLNEKANFTNHILSCDGIDMIYLFSDGFADQFGGDKNSKFLSKRFKELLMRIHKMPVSVQHKLLNESFESWKGENFQVDDVLVFGIRIPRSKS